MFYKEVIILTIIALKDWSVSASEAIAKHTITTLPKDNDRGLFKASMKAVIDGSVANHSDASTNMPKALQDYPFKGRVVVRGSSDYDSARYQYATTGEYSHTKPYAVVYVQKDENHHDIMTAIDYAIKNDCSLAVRSGGHQYLGFSSTVGDNLQLDMSHYKDFDWDEENSQLTLGPAWNLREIQHKCVELGIYFPHGECVGVGIGGHCQTGGYSLYSHSFGMFIDYISWFEIITADKKVRRVTRPNKYAKDEDNDDLWFSVLGGSPGNFGVVVRLAVDVLHDKDFPDCKVFAAFLPFNQEILEDALRIVEATSDDKELSHNIEYSVMAVSAGSQHKYKYEDDQGQRLKLKVEQMPIKGDIRDWMLKIIQNYGEVPIPIMGIFACYTGADKSQAGKDSGKEWWNKHMKELERIKENAFKLVATKPIETLLYKAMNLLMGSDGTKHTKISKMDEITSWKFDREFNLPFQKRVYNGADQNLKARGFAKWAAQKCWELESKSRAGANSGLKLGCQFITGGSKGSKFGPSEYPTAIGHRMAATSAATFDFFYQTRDKNNLPWKQPFEDGTKWLDTNPDSVCKTAIGKEGKFADVDRRFMYAPWGTEKEPWSTKVELDSEEMIPKYFTSKDDYLRVRKTKLRFDPHNVFTPNCFCVGYDTLNRKDSGLKL